MAVTKSGTGRGSWERGLGDLRMWGLWDTGNQGCGTRGHWDVGLGMWDARTSKLNHSGTRGHLGTRGRGT